MRLMAGKVLIVHSHRVTVAPPRGAKSLDDVRPPYREQGIETKYGPGSLNCWLTVADAASYLKTKPRTLLKWVRAGSIKAYPLHGTKRRVWRFRYEDLDAALGFVATYPASMLNSQLSSAVLQ
jgi:excisionase family DNA binding protein